MATKGTHLADALLAPAPQKEGDWIEYLKSRIDPLWRPGEYDHESLTFFPDPDNPRTSLKVCSRPQCDVRGDGAVLCPSCGKDWRAARETGTTLEEFLQTPRTRFVRRYGCLVPECPRSHRRNGLCGAHAEQQTKAARKNPGLSVDDWMTEAAPTPFPPADPCLALCGEDRTHASGLCNEHQRQFANHSAANPGAPLTPGEWVARYTEPPITDHPSTAYAKLTALPFFLLNEPLRWEILYAAQKRDKAGRAHISPVRDRIIYLNLRRSGVVTAVGMQQLGMAGTRQELAAIVTEWQRHIDDAYRDWTGNDERDPNVIWLSEIPTKAKKRPGPNANVDLNPFADWIADGIKSWILAAPRSTEAIKGVVRGWTVANEILNARGVPPHLLGRPDMDAVIDGINDYWARRGTQRRGITGIRLVLTYARNAGDLTATWGSIPGTFAVDPTRHRATGDPERGEGDEPFRFVPQPIMDHLMDHLGHYERKDEFKTAEARAMIFVHERCGRRTSETLALLDDCITYDDAGSPYLEWRRGKPPYTQGKRLPIHQETHDVIRDWQQFKREHGIKSKWLFPSSHYSGRDEHYSSTFLATRITEFVTFVEDEYPYRDAVHGADGNLVYFDMSVIDPYSFRHAFAQRLADATDAEGRPTVPPDVLQEYMGHKNFNTTMAYYEVTAKRRKRVLDSLPARRLNLRGEAVRIDHERDGFTKIAVTLGHCTEPQNVAANGHMCMLEHACESCPFFLVDPLERDGISAKRHSLNVKLERARIIASPQHLLDHYEARIKDCDSIIDGIDAFVAGLPDDERSAIEEALEEMADVRRRATTPRRIDLRGLLVTKEAASAEE
jgi:integrase